MALKDSSGNTTVSYNYDPFGKVTASNAHANAFKFSSEYHDSETGLVYYNYCYYSPILGRWLKPDPIEEQGGWNLYGMVNNNSNNWFDSNGNRPENESLVRNDDLVSLNIKHVPKGDSYGDKHSGHGNIPDFGGFIVFPEKTKCRSLQKYNGKNEIGKIVLVQYLGEKDSKGVITWTVDGKPKESFWYDGQKKRRVFAYTDAPKKGVRYFDTDPSKGYIDTPGLFNVGSSPSLVDYTQIFRVEAFCRTKCEDDRYMSSAMEFSFSREKSTSKTDVTDVKYIYMTWSEYPEYYE